MTSDLPLGTLRLDREQVILSADEAFARLFDCIEADVAGKSLHDIMSPRDRKASLELATKMTRAGTNLVDVLITLRIARVDHLARLRLRRSGDGYVVFAEPIGGDDDLVYKLTVVEQRWKGLFRSSTDGIVILDPDGRILEHNPGFFTLLPLYDNHRIRLSEEAVLGRRVADLIGGEFPDLGSALSGLDEELLVHSLAVRNRRAGKDVTDPSAHFLELRATPVHLPNRAWLGTFVLVRDIAEEMQIEARDRLIREDLLRARDFQRAILFQPGSPLAADVDVGYRPLHEVGGDVFDVTLLERDCLRVFVADATGHGVPAAFATMLIKNTYDLVKEETRDPAEVLRLLDDRIATRYKALDVLFTAVVVDVDLESGKIIHASGGHPAPLLVRGADVVELESGGPPLGAVPGQTYPKFERLLEGGDGLYVFTDGLAEARRSKGEYFGDARLRDAVRQAHSLRRAPCDAVLNRVDAWLRPESATDDMTIVHVRPH